MKSNSNFNKAFKCANEKEVCSCHGKVIFGKDNRWTDEKEVYGTIACTNMKFKDIFPGVKKECWCTPSGNDSTNFLSI